MNSGLCLSARRDVVRRDEGEHVTASVQTLHPAGTGKLELMGGCSADVVGLDWATDISAARMALGPSRPVQAGNRMHPARLQQHKDV